MSTWRAVLTDAAGVAYDTGTVRALHDRCASTIPSILSPSEPGVLLGRVI